MLEMLALSVTAFVNDNHIDPFCRVLRDGFSVIICEAGCQGESRRSRVAGALFLFPSATIRQNPISKELLYLVVRQRPVRLLACGYRTISLRKFHVIKILHYWFSSRCCFE